MDNNTIIFNPSEPIREGDEIDLLLKSLMTGTEEQQKVSLCRMAQARLRAISQTDGAKTTSAEDKLLAWAIQNGDNPLKKLASTVALLQLDNYIIQEVRKFHVRPDEVEDMEQDAREQVLIALPKYNGEQKLSTFARLYIKDALVRHLGAVDYAGNKKWRMWLQGAITASITRLKMAGINRPTPAQIAADLNGQGLYRPVTEKNIVEAMNLKKTVVSLDGTDRTDDGEGRSRHETVGGSAPSPEEICVKVSADEALMKKLDEIIATLDTGLQYVWGTRLHSFEERGKDATQQVIIEQVKKQAPNYSKAYIKTCINRFDAVMRQKMTQYDPDAMKSGRIVERILETLSEM